MQQTQLRNKIMNSTTRICIYNCQSLSNKFLSINHYISVNKIDIMCLNETFLSESTKSVNLIKNFSIIRQDRKQKGGGVAFIIHKDISYEIIESKSTQDHEFIAIEITSKEEKITLLNAYVHPKSKTDFNFVSRIAKKNSNKMILVGDLNSTNISWSCNSTNTRGKRLETICSNNNLLILNSSTPTSRKSTNIIDMVISSEILFNRIEEVTVDTDFDMSDHWPVVFNFVFKPGRPEVNKINWEDFKTDLQSKIQHKRFDIASNEDLDYEANLFATDIVEVLHKNTKKVEKKSYKVNVPLELLKMIKAKKKLNRIYSFSHDRDVKNLINSLSNQIKRYNKKLLNEKWNDQCAFLANKKPSEPVYWKIVKQIDSGNQPKSQTVLPGIKSADEKAEIFSEYYSNIFKNTYLDRNYANIFDPGISNIPKITTEETIYSIKSAKSTISTGLDGISYKVIKNLPEIALEHLTVLFNHSLKLNYVPRSWKVAKIKVLKKKSDDLDNPGSYRPISLLATISRVLEKIMNIRLTDWAETNNLLHVNQSGFRKNHSCQDNIFKMIETCKAGLQCELKCGRVDFDVEKAFDQAPHKGILLTLKEYNCPSYIGNWLVSFLTDRKFVVEIDGSISRERDILAGVPQGSPLSPLLFALYINDLGKLLDKHKINFALFADDVTIWSIEKSLITIEFLLQVAINEINDFFIHKGLKLNGKKCVYSIFTT
jgi:exonuclease III